MGSRIQYPVCQCNHRCNRCVCRHCLGIALVGHAGAACLGFWQWCTAVAAATVPYSTSACADAANPAAAAAGDSDAEDAADAECQRSPCCSFTTSAHGHDGSSGAGRCVASRDQCHVRACSSCAAPAATWRFDSSNSDRDSVATTSTVQTAAAVAAAATAATAAVVSTAT